MSKLEFVYVIYIQATAEKVWDGLTDPRFTRQYWFHEMVCDNLNPGTRWEHRESKEGGKTNVVGEVLENEHPRRLVLSWAEPKNEGNPDETSRLTYEITDMDWPGGPWVQLRVIHSELTKRMHDSISFGWPGVCSGLKTLLERGTIASPESK